MAQDLEGQVRGLPKITELRQLDEDEALSSLVEPSASGQSGATKKEEKKKKKRKSSGSPDVEVKKKRVVVRVRKSNKKSTKARVTDPDSLFRLRDYLEDDDLEFITHGSTIDGGDQEEIREIGQEIDHPLAREPEGESETASVLHHESFLWSCLEISQLEFELKEQARKKDMYMALSEQQDESLKDLPTLRAELEKVQEKINLIEQLWAEMDKVKGTAEALRGRMDLLASKKEATKEELSSVKDQLRVAKDKADKWSRLNDELRAQMNSAVTEQDALGQEYTALKSKLKATLIVSSEVEEMLA
ncbi:uncharacterized protein [Nicotiana tomentosiformis]|uniref:uncharacterized protein n=1 Tax=Nicotiana tomentosiformis TaxID=4098 RepID=UPI00388CC567